MDKIDILLQGAGISRMVVIAVPAEGVVRDIISAAKEQSTKLPDTTDLQVWLEDSDEPLNPDEAINKVGIQKHSRVHIHTCHRIGVSVNYQGKTQSHPFAPSTTISTVKMWADKRFNLNDVDATEYALQLCNSSERPSDDIQLGALTSPSECSVCFDLVPKQRVEG